MEQLDFLCQEVVKYLIKLKRSLRRDLCHSVSRILIKPAASPGTKLDLAQFFFFHFLKHSCAKFFRNMERPHRQLSSFMNAAVVLAIPLAQCKY